MCTLEFLNPTAFASPLAVSLMVPEIMGAVTGQNAEAPGTDEVVLADNAVLDEYLDAPVILDEPDISATNAPTTTPVNLWASAAQAVKNFTNIFDAPVIDTGLPKGLQTLVAGWNAAFDFGAMTGGISDAFATAMQGSIAYIKKDEPNNDPDSPHERAGAEAHTVEPDRFGDITLNPGEKIFDSKLPDNWIGPAIQLIGDDGLKSGRTYVYGAKGLPWRGQIQLKGNRSHPNYLKPTWVVSHTGVSLNGHMMREGLSYPLKDNDILGFGAENKVKVNITPDGKLRLSKFVAKQSAGDANAKAKSSTSASQGQPAQEIAGRTIHPDGSHEYARALIKKVCLMGKDPVNSTTFYVPEWRNKRKTAYIQKYQSLLGEVWTYLGDKVIYPNGKTVWESGEATMWLGDLNDGDLIKLDTNIFIQVKINEKGNLILKRIQEIPSAQPDTFGDIDYGLEGKEFSKASKADEENRIKFGETPATNRIFRVNAALLKDDIRTFIEFQNKAWWILQPNDGFGNWEKLKDNSVIELNNGCRILVTILPSGNLRLKQIDNVGQKDIGQEDIGQEYELSAGRDPKFLGSSSDAQVRIISPNLSGKNIEFTWISSNGWRMSPVSGARPVLVNGFDLEDTYPIQGETLISIGELNAKVWVTPNGQLKIKIISPEEAQDLLQKNSGGYHEASPEALAKKEKIKTRLTGQNGEISDVNVWTYLWGSEGGTALKAWARLADNFAELPDSLKLSVLVKSTIKTNGNHKIAEEALKNVETWLKQQDMPAKKLELALADQQTILNARKPYERKDAALAELDFETDYLFSRKVPRYLASQIGQVMLDIKRNLPVVYEKIIASLADTSNAKDNLKNLMVEVHPDTRPIMWSAFYEHLYYYVSSIRSLIHGK